MSRYVFDKPEQMFHWIDECAKKLLVISREEFGRIEINIKRANCGATYEWEINPEDKQSWRRKFENENVRKNV